MKRLTAITVAAALILCAAAARGQDRAGAQGDVVDKMVATVSGELVTYTDLIWQLALEPDTPLDNPRPDDLRRALESIIDQRLFFVEAHRMPHLEPKAAEVEKALADLVRRFRSQDEFQRRAARVGLTAERLREIVTERIEIEKYIDFRFRSFVIVTADEISGYYRDVYVPRFRRRSPGRIVPKLEEARAEVEATLKEAKIASDIAQFLEEARARAEVVTLSPPQ
jgi:hypothetical protein